jgi:spore maturation protein B
METINYLSNLAIPITILSILIVGIREKNKIFNTFLDGAKEGIEITLKIL